MLCQENLLFHLLLILISLFILMNLTLKYIPVVVMALTILRVAAAAVLVSEVLLNLLLTFLLLLFGEIMPKVFARQNALQFCRRAVGGVLVARKMFWPIENILLRSRVLADSLLQKENHVLSVDELGQALELTDKDDIKDEKSMLQGIIRFGDETVKEIMTSRKDVVDIDIKSLVASWIITTVGYQYIRIIQIIFVVFCISRIFCCISENRTASGGRVSSVHLISFRRPRKLMIC